MTTAPEPTRARRRAALAVALLLPLALFAAAAEAIDRPVRGSASGAGRSGRAAIAIRDAVHPVETLGTWLLVEPHLADAYAEVFTFTQQPRPGTARSVSKRSEQKPEFLAALTSALSRYERVDLFLLAHTNAYIDWVAEIAPELLRGLGLVYNSGCDCGQQNQRWTALGVDAYVAHPDTASHASFFVYFLRRWIAGRRLDEAVAGANARSDLLFDRLERLGLAADAAQAWRRSRARIWGAPQLTLAGARP